MNLDAFLGDFNPIQETGHSMVKDLSIFLRLCFNFWDVSGWEKYRQSEVITYMQFMIPVIFESIPSFLVNYFDFFRINIEKVLFLCINFLEHLIGNLWLWYEFILNFFNRNDSLFEYWVMKERIFVTIILLRMEVELWEDIRL